MLPIGKGSLGSFILAVSEGRRLSVILQMRRGGGMLC